MDRTIQAENYSLAQKELSSFWIRPARQELAYSYSSIVSIGLRMTTLDPKAAVHRIYEHTSPNKPKSVSHLKVSVASLKIWEPTNPALSKFCTPHWGVQLSGNDQAQWSEQHGGIPP